MNMLKSENSVLLLVNFYFDSDSIVRHQRRYFFRPFYKAVISAVQVFFKADIDGFLQIFNSVEIKVKNTFVVSNIVLIDNSESWTGNQGSTS